MSTVSRENPAYITVVVLYSKPHINLMEWDERAGDYQITSSRTYEGTLIQAQSLARQWAEEEGLEVR